MLMTNPITYVLYEYGYDGSENIYEYWTENKKDIIEYLNEKRPEILQKGNHLEEFEIKVRWGSPIGVLMRFEIRKMFRKSTAGAVLDFKNIQLKYGNRLYSLEDFSNLYPCNRKNASKKIDLRGIGIINNDIKNVTIKNVDMAYVSLDSTSMTNVCFSGCNLDHVRFCRGELIDCEFDKQCSMSYIDFSGTYIRSVFDAPIDHPIITKLRKRDILDILMGSNPRWRPYSEVWGTSFVEHCQVENICGYIPRLQAVLDETYQVSSASLLRRIEFMLQILISPLEF
ncbi:hypothetical protein R9X47_09970 [Wukongibacter baidiensis]|uniref:pentapeptide repeat-containing protein n=1 Tax=Wukongibacter baidiensis TaxID=1723361 RepID=UPI003D7F4749